MPSFTIARSALERLPVLRVEVWVDTHTSAPGPDEPERHVFEPGTATDPAEATWSPRHPEAVTGYRLRTLFDDDRQPWESPTIPVEPGRGVVETIEIEDFGVRIFDALGLPFGIIEAVEVSFHDLAGQPQQVRLTAGSPLYPIFAGTDYKYGEPIAYSLDYLLANGNYLEPNRSSSQSLIAVADPLTEKTVTFEAVGLAPDAVGAADETVQVIQLTYGHLEDGPGWAISGGEAVTQLSSAQPTKQLTFAVVDPGQALTSYQGITILGNGEQSSIPKTLIPETTIRVGEAPIWWTVEVDPGLVDWASYRLVLVEIRADNAIDGHTAQPAATLLFWAGVPSRYWSFLVPREHSGTYTWRARYFEANGTYRSTAERTETSHQAILPARVSGARGGREEP